MSAILIKYYFLKLRTSYLLHMYLKKLLLDLTLNPKRHSFLNVGVESWCIQLWDGITDTVVSWYHQYWKTTKFVSIWVLDKWLLGPLSTISKSSYFLPVFLSDILIAKSKNSAATLNNPYKIEVGFAIVNVYDISKYLSHHEPPVSLKSNPIDLSGTYYRPLRR